jgi:hypothetical protein
LWSNEYTNRGAAAPAFFFAVAVVRAGFFADFFVAGGTSAKSRRGDPR